MKLPGLLMLIVLPLGAATVSDTDTSVLLHAGDSLAFEVLTWNFGFNAARFGLPAYPTDVTFTFVSAPVPADAAVSAWLESPDGGTYVPFAGSTAFLPGLFSSSQFSGIVSTLQGYMHLSPSDSAAIFQTGAAELILVNDGPDLLLGLPPNTLRHDLSVSLTGGPLSVGAMSASVTFQQAVPEPSTLFPASLALGVFFLRRR